MSSNVIRLLPEAIANQIAAGEVAPAPSYVVKELLENSIDAGAIRISLEVGNGGMDYVQVTDNGRGMSPTDARMAFERHATSKICHAEDLSRLSTMGFRGEALAAICAISRVELKTRPKDDELGTAIYISGSELVSSEVCACPEGTSIKVKDIFFNTPARRRYLRSERTEYSRLVDEFDRVALAYPEVAMSLSHNGVLSKDLPASSLKERIIAVGGRKLQRDLLTINYTGPAFSIKGYIGTPAHATKSSKLQYFFVNGRYMRHPGFAKAVAVAYDNIINPGYSPNYFIYFDVPAENIDVNVHPTKTEIRFVDEPLIWQVLSVSIRESLSAHAAIPSIDFDRDAPLDIPAYRSSVSGRGSAVPPTLSSGLGSKVFGTGSNGLGLSTSRRVFGTRQISSDSLDWDQLANNFEADRKLEPQPSLFSTEDTSPIFLERDMPVQSSPGSSLIYEGAYLLAVTRRGMALVHLQRAHYRLLYDKYMADKEHMEVEMIRPMYPELISVATGDLPLVDTIFPSLSRWGIELEDRGQGQWAIVSTPLVLEEGIGEFVQLLLESLHERVQDADLCVQEALARALAGRQSKEYTTVELQNIDHDHFLAELFASSDPNLTPTGELIISLMTPEELESRFR